MDIPTREELYLLLSRAQDAFVWASGSADFGDGGAAKKGWDRIVSPLLDDIRATLQDSGQSEPKPAMTLAEMRDAEVPTPSSLGHLCAYVRDLLKQEHDYDTVVYAMSMAAHATFRYVASQLGASGFQASCAGFDFMRRSRRIDGPFMLILGEHMLYPQYDIDAELNEALDSWGAWAAKEVQKKLAEHPEGTVAAEVYEHWTRLARGEKYPLVPRDIDEVLEKISVLKDAEDELFTQLVESIEKLQDMAAPGTADEGELDANALLQRAGFAVVKIDPEHPVTQWRCDDCGTEYKEFTGVEPLCPIVGCRSSNATEVVEKG